ncbi:hypothetical protein Q8791_23195 [Nocardiopsis sp. CT-R113]|uniref:Uncharacterized protein n=1 Tax=Nocardiopsis codii TaxID=3065942 RepID=A0ABU7KD11_9ACTN|nr:hypothetical protein [Nocardiopsis sp. CT-R113]MEE2040128.1 hypothetical protein [Nocardiopsis sp. CT-R113]
MKLSETMKAALVRLLDAQEEGTSRVATKKAPTTAALARRGLVAYSTVAFGTSYALTLTDDGREEAERIRAEDTAEEARKDAEPEPMHMRNLGGTLCGEPGPDTAGTGHVDCEGCRELLAAEAERIARGIYLCPVWEVPTDECECSDCEDLHADNQAEAGEEPPAPLPRRERATRIEDAIDRHHGVDLDKARKIAAHLGTAGLSVLQSADEDGYLTAGHPASLASMAGKELVKQAEHPAAGGGPRTYRITRLGQTVARMKAAALDRTA